MYVQRLSLAYEMLYKLNYNITFIIKIDFFLRFHLSKYTKNGMMFNSKSIYTHNYISIFIKYVCYKLIITFQCLVARQ